MFSHYSIEILPFEGQQSKSTDKADSNNSAVVSTTIERPKQPVNAFLNQQRAEVKAVNSAYKSGNLGILDALSPKKKASSAEELAVVEGRDQFSQEELERQIHLFAHEKKNKERKDSLFSTLTSCKVDVHDEVHVKLNLINAVQSKELDFYKMELLTHLRKALNNGAITFDYRLEEKKATSASFTDKKSQFDKLAEENPSLEKFRKLFNLDIEF